MKKVLISILLIFAILVGGVFIWYLGENKIMSKSERAEVTALVENFGSKMKDVSLSSPKNIIISEMKSAYSPFISKSLMDSWEQDPSEIIGRLTSSPWPEKIEIDSIEKLDKYKIDVKGKIVYVASGNGKLVETGKTPIELTIRKVPQTKEFQIDRIRYGEYSSPYYNKYRKELLHTLKEAFPNMNFIGKNGHPYVVESFDFTANGTPRTIAIVDMACGGASTEYYTVCKLEGKALKVVNFKDKNGKITPLFFTEGGSIKYTERVKFINDEKDNFILYHIEILRNDAGEVTSIAVDAYKWNNSENLFEYSKEFSEKIRETSEKQLMPKTVYISSLKYSSIKTKFSAIESVFVYGKEVAFSCGSGKLVPNLPGSANTNHIVVYNTETGKVEYSQEISKNWMRIDKVQMNDNWILFRAVLDKAGCKTTCFAINRKTGKITNLLKNYSGFRANDILLQDSYAAIILEGIESGNTEGITKLIRINLNNDKGQKYLENASGTFRASKLWELENDCAALSASEVKNGDVKQYVYLYSFTGRSSDIVDIPKHIETYVIPPDEDINKIIYLYENGQIVIAPLRKPDDFEEIGLKVFNFISYDTVASKDYIAVKLDNGDIFIFNRKIKERTVIKGIEGKINLNGDELTIVKRPENTSDSIIFVDLKENGF